MWNGARAFTNPFNLVVQVDLLCMVMTSDLFLFLLRYSAINICLSGWFSACFYCSISRNRLLSCSSIVASRLELVGLQGWEVYISAFTSCVLVSSFTKIPFRRGSKDQRTSRVSRWRRCIYQGQQQMVVEVCRSQIDVSLGSHCASRRTLQNQTDFSLSTRRSKCHTSNLKHANTACGTGS